MLTFLMLGHSRPNSIQVLGGRTRCDVGTAGVLPEYSRAAVKAWDADIVWVSMPSLPIFGGTAAERIAAVLGTPNVIGEKVNGTAFVVRRFVDRGLLADLNTNPDGTLHRPG